MQHAPSSSCRRRQSKWANAALVVGTDASDWTHLEPQHGVLAGIALQQAAERCQASRLLACGPLHTCWSPHVQTNFLTRDRVLGSCHDMQGCSADGRRTAGVPSAARHRQAVHTKVRRKHCGHCKTWLSKMQGVVMFTRSQHDITQRNSFLHAQTSWWAPSRPACCRRPATGWGCAQRRCTSCTRQTSHRHCGRCRSSGGWSATHGLLLRELDGPLHVALRLMLHSERTSSGHLVLCMRRRCGGLTSSCPASSPSLRCCTVLRPAPLRLFRLVRAFCCWHAVCRTSLTRGG